MPKKTFVLEVNPKNLILGGLSAIMIAVGLFIFTSIMSGRWSFENSPYPRQDRGVILLLSWSLVCIPFLILAPNKNGLVPALGVFLGLYLSCAYMSGTLMVFDFNPVDISVATKILVPPIFFIVILVVLLYNYASGQEFFKSVIFGGFAVGFLIIGSLVGIL